MRLVCTSNTSILHAVFAENWNKAREMLDLGLNNLAKPIEELQEARKKLELRLMRDSVKQQRLNTSTSSDMDCDDEETRLNALPQVPRKALGRLVGVGTSSEAPMFRFAHGSPGAIAKTRPGAQALSNDSFEIFTNVPPPLDDAQEAQTSSGVGRIADEFANDPEYQVSPFVLVL